MTPQGPQAVVVARLPGAAAVGLVAPPSARSVPVADLADPVVVAELVAARARALRTGEPRVAATVWWYSASAVLLAPPLAGLVAGVPLSARSADLVLSIGSGGLPVAAISTAGSADPGAELRELLTVVIEAVAEVGGLRQPPLWAIATDSLAGGLLTLGRVLGAVLAVTGLVRPAGGGGRAAPAGAAIRGPRRLALRPAGVLLPDLPAAGRAAVHLLPAPAIRRAGADVAQARHWALTRSVPVGTSRRSCGNVSPLRRQAPGEVGVAHEDADDIAEIDPFAVDVHRFRVAAALHPGRGLRRSVPLPCGDGVAECVRRGG